MSINPSKLVTMEGSRCNIKDQLKAGGFVKPNWVTWVFLFIYSLEINLMKASSPRYLETLAKRASFSTTYNRRLSQIERFFGKCDRVGMHKTRNWLVDIERRSKEGAENDFVLRRQPLFHHMHFFLSFFRYLFSVLSINVRLIYNKHH